MALSGQLIWGPIGNGAYFSFEWAANQNTSTRTSTISWKMYGRGRYSSPTYIASNYYLYINGSTVSSFTNSWDGSSDFSFNDAKKASGSFTVYHDEDGNGSFSASIYAFISSSSYNWDTTSTTFYLDSMSPLIKNYSWKSLGSGNASNISYNLSTYQVGYYLYTPTQNGTMIIQTSGSYDTYGGIGVNGNLTLNTNISNAGANVVTGTKLGTIIDDYSGTNFYLSGISVEANKTYRIYVHEYNGDSAISGTLNISFTANYIISYDANGGSGTINNQIIIPGNSVTLQSNNFTAPSSASHSINLYDSDGTTKLSSSFATFQNNTFYRWLIGSNYYQPGTVITPSGNTTVKAIWTTNYKLNTPTKSTTTSNGYLITYNSNGGNCSKSNETVIDFTDYIFYKWINLSTGTQYNTGAIVGDYNTQSYKVQWTTSKRLGSITLPQAYKDSSEIVATITLDPGKGKCDITSIISKGRTTYTFNGWYLNNTFIGAAGTSYTPQSNNTLTAKYTSTTGSYSQIFLPTPYRVGYKFLGWSTNPNATSGITGYYTPSGNDVLYAIWRENIIYIPIDNSIKKAQVFIFNNNKWNDAQAFIVNNNKWNKSG